MSPLQTNVWKNDSNIKLDLGSTWSRRGDNDDEKKKENADKYCPEYSPVDRGQLDEPWLILDTPVPVVNVASDGEWPGPASTSLSHVDFHGCADVYCLHAPLAPPTTMERSGWRELGELRSESLEPVVSPPLATWPRALVTTQLRGNTLGWKTVTCYNFTIRFKDPEYTKHKIVGQQTIASLVFNEGCVWWRVGGLQDFSVSPLITYWIYWNLLGLDCFFGGGLGVWVWDLFRNRAWQLLSYFLERFTTLMPSASTTFLPDGDLKPGPQNSSQADKCLTSTAVTDPTYYI